MKIIRIVLYGIVGIVALLLIAALFMPANYSVEKSVEIAAPDSAVFAQVVDFNNWLKWNPWTEMDPQAETMVSGEPGTIGARWSWKGEQIGEGSLTIRSIEPNRKIVNHLEFVAPNSSEATDVWIFEPTANGTKVTWSNQGALGYPIERLMGPMIEGFIGETFEKGLRNLKSACEQ